MSSGDISDITSKSWLLRLTSFSKANVRQEFENEKLILTLAKQGAIVYVLSPVASAMLASLYKPKPSVLDFQCH